MSLPPLSAAALMVYSQCAVIILNLPLTWMPEPLNAVQGSSEQDAASSGWQAFVQALVWIMGNAMGRMASLDCLLQSWGLWQSSSTHDTTTSVFFRAVCRCVLVGHRVLVGLWLHRLACIPLTGQYR